MSYTYDQRTASKKLTPAPPASSRTWSTRCRKQKR